MHYIYLDLIRIILFDIFHFTYFVVGIFNLILSISIFSDLQVQINQFFNKIVDFSTQNELAALAFPMLQAKTANKSWNFMQKAINHASYDLLYIFV